MLKKNTKGEKPGDVNTVGQGPLTNAKPEETQATGADNEKAAEEKAAKEKEAADKKAAKEKEAADKKAKKEAEKAQRAEQRAKVKELKVKEAAERKLRREEEKAARAAAKAAGPADVPRRGIIHLIPDTKMPEFRGKRAEIVKCLKDGITVDDFCKAAKGNDGGVGDIRIYLEKKMITLEIPPVPETPAKTAESAPATESAPPASADASQAASSEVAQ